ncbi:hypothetical protein J5N97_008201 [Dioscorea zingiberensis]|uniref:ER membrane protein complex subunit 4 n=1 Tax=Dioscorea zingiberensis TaxID=325984 RepID=A0A9D5DGA3_9LILI|nr:hypothetical protein J5N97_008201 [Dioscorea zingiberensis]
MGPVRPEVDRIPVVCWEETLAWDEHAKKIAREVMGMMCEGLGLDTLEDMLMVCHYYEPCPEPDRTFGIVDQTDAAVLTVLIQDMIGGLKVKKEEDGKEVWVDVKPIPGALVINVGELLQTTAMEKGKGLARRWAVEFAEGPEAADVPDPLGFAGRSSLDLDDANQSRQKKEAEATWKSQKAWEVAQSPFKNLMMMGFMMWMAGNTVHLFSIGITFSALWQPISALQSVGKVFEPYKDPRVDTLAPKLLFIALNLAAMGLGVWKLNTLGLLPTHASDWVSSLAPAQEVEFASGGFPIY